METKELLKKVKHIEINTRKIINTVFSGEYHSAFKGKGMEFEEVREYSYGDDIRFIDWNVTARTNHPYIKVFKEERELIVNLVVDISGSSFFGTANQLKYDLITEICAILAFSAMKNNDKVGLILFSDTIEKYIPPKKGKKHVMYILREILFHNHKNYKTDISAALEFLNKVQKKKSTVFLFSDFYADNYENALRITAKNHDLVSIVFNDIREQNFINLGLAIFRDAENNSELLIDTSSSKFKMQFKKNIENHFSSLNEMFKRYEIDNIKIETGKAYEKQLINFFKKRILK